jgi:hypothetical protein
MKAFPKMLDVAPFARWLDVYLGEGDHKMVALELGLSERRARSYLNGEQRLVGFNSVDRALSRATRIVELDGRQIFWVGDLYPEIEGEVAA